ncbi:MAG: hypothetical protein RL721_1116 [Candidatus Eisenbacteria bacterium]|jgi:CDGSH-type Zn-finger protein
MAGTIITIMSSGSIRVEGDFELRDQDGKAFDLGGRTRIGLCRCGASANKPFCDGAHKGCGFDSPVQAVVLPPPAPKPGA